VANDASVVGAGFEAAIEPTAIGLPVVKALVKAVAAGQSLTGGPRVVSTCCAREDGGGRRDRRGGSPRNLIDTDVVDMHLLLSYKLVIQRA